MELICCYCDTINPVEFFDDIIECANCGKEIRKENSKLEGLD